MPYELLEKEIKSRTDQQQEAVILFVRFLATQEADRIVVSKGGVRERKLGGFEKDFYIAPDFDEPIKDFEEYM